MASTRVAYVGRVRAGILSNAEGCLHFLSVHKKCSGVKGKLKKDPGYGCAKCVRGGGAEGGAEKQEVVLEDGSSLECVNRFC